MTCSLSIITTTLTAYKYGTSATANVLEILPRSNALYLAIMLVTLQLCLSSAVGHSALFQHVEDWLKIPKGKIICQFHRILISVIVIDVCRVQLEAMSSPVNNNRFRHSDCRDIAKI